MSRYILKSQKEINKCYNLILKYYKFIEKKNGSNNLIKLLLHELAYFFFTNISIKNIKNKNKYLVRPIFLKRNKKNIFLNYPVSYNRKIINFFINFLPFKKKVLINNFVPLSKKELIRLTFFLILKGYKPIFSYNRFFQLENVDYQKKIIFKLIKNIIAEFRLKKVNLDEIYKQINTFIDKNISNSITEVYDFYISGTPGNIFNRITCHNALLNRKKVIFLSHNKECGFVNAHDIQYDDYSNCTHLIGYGGEGKINKKNIFHPIGKIKVNYYTSNNYSNFTKKVLNINFKKFMNFNNGIYISGKIQNLSCIGLRVLNPLDYLKWQKKLLSKFPHLKIKTHPKQKYLIKYKNTKTNSTISDIIKEADFLVLDNPDASSFTEVAVSNKPIIFFDLGYTKFSPVQIKFLKSRTYYFKINLENISFDKFENIFLKTKDNRFSEKYAFDSNSETQLKTVFEIIKTIN